MQQTTIIQNQASTKKYILRDNQNRFTEKKSTTAQIFTLRRIIEGVQEKQLSAVIIFVDFSKAFVHRLIKNGTNTRGMRYP